MNKTTRVGWLLSLMLVAAGSWLATAYWFGRDLPDPSVQQRSLHSATLAESRDYQIHLPDGYAQSPGKRYPVIYVLDGGSQSAHTAASAAVMARIGAMPDAIVVGIPSGEMRARDYTPPGMHQKTDDADSPDGEADRFLTFLQRELIPQVERDVRANGDRVLAGYSRGGLFVIHALVAQPGLFRAYVANSPALWRDDGKMVTRLERFLLDTPGVRATLFLSLGSEENAKMTKAYRQAIAVLQRGSPAGLRWKAYLTSGATHNDNARKATPLALQWAYPVDALR